MGAHSVEGMDGIVYPMGYKVNFCELDRIRQVQIDWTCEGKPEPQTLAGRDGLRSMCLLGHAPGCQAGRDLTLGRL